MCGLLRAGLPRNPRPSLHPCLFAVGACKRDAKLLKVFIVGLPMVMFLYLIPGLVLSTASKKPIMAWYLLNAEDFKDDRAECTQKWVDDTNRFITIQTIMNWVTYFILCAIWSHILYTAHCARAPRGCHESGTRHQGLAGGAGWRSASLSSSSLHLTPAASQHPAGKYILESAPVELQGPAPVPMAVATAVATPAVAVAHAVAAAEEPAKGEA